MSVGPLGMIGSAAGSPLSQAKGSDADKSAQDAADQARHVDSSKSAEKASGIGQTEQHEQASDRDADGRRLWERQQQPGDESVGGDDLAEPDPPDDAPHSKDATGQCGNHLDLSV